MTIPDIHKDINFSDSEIREFLDRNGYKIVLHKYRVVRFWGSDDITYANEEVAIKKDRKDLTEFDSYESKYQYVFERIIKEIYLQELKDSLLSISYIRDKKIDNILK